MTDNAKIDETNKGLEIIKIIHTYLPTEGWIEAFIKDLNNAGFRIIYDPESPTMVLKKRKKHVAWTD